jgi:hypothetical protein
MLRFLPSFFRRNNVQLGHHLYDSESYMLTEDATLPHNDLPTLQANCLKDIQLLSNQYCVLDNFPFPIFQRGPNCKLMMLYYLMEYQRLNATGEKSFSKFVPVRKKIFVEKDDSYFNQQASELDWQVCKERNSSSIITKYHPQLNFLFQYGTTSLRAQAKHLGSMVGEVYDPRILTTLAQKNGFNRSGFYLPEINDYLDTIKNCLHRGVPVGIFFDICLEKEGSHVVNKASENEHACIVIGYFVEKHSQKLQFVILNWGKVTYIDADKLCESTYQLADKREPEIFATPYLHPSKWLNSSEEKAEIFDNDFELTRTARELLSDHVSLKGKLFVVDTYNHKRPISKNINFEDRATSMLRPAFNSNIIIPAKDYAKEHADMKKISADAYDSFDDSESSEDYGYSF